jgi:hypothetical protein
LENISRIFADPSVCDAPRILRLAGFKHQKGSHHEPANDAERVIVAVAAPSAPQFLPKRSFVFRRERA